MLIYTQPGFAWISKKRMTYIRVFPILVLHLARLDELA